MGGLAYGFVPRIPLKFTAFFSSNSRYINSVDAVIPHDRQSGYDMGGNRKG